MNIKHTKVYSVKFILNNDDIKQYYEMLLKIRDTLFDKEKHGVSLDGNGIIVSATELFNEDMIKFYIDKYKPHTMELYVYDLRDFKASKPSERYSKDTYNDYTVEHFVNINKTSITESIIITISKDKIFNNLSEILSLMRI